MKSPFNFKYSYKRKAQAAFRPVVLVTGCGSGIGLALARLLRDKTDYRIVITARAGSTTALKSEFPDSDRLMLRSLDVTDEAQEIICFARSRSVGRA